MKLAEAKAYQNSKLAKQIKLNPFGYKSNFNWFDFTGFFVLWKSIWEKYSQFIAFSQAIVVFKQVNVTFIAVEQSYVGKMAWNVGLNVIH